MLNSKLQGREQKLTASVHLSVVPKSSGVGRAERHERHLVAAIRLSDEIQDQPAVVSGFNMLLGPGIIILIDFCVSTCFPRV